MQDFNRAGLRVYFTQDEYVKFAADTRQAANAILAMLGSMEATGYSQERSKLVTRGLNPTLRMAISLVCHPHTAWCGSCLKKAATRSEPLRTESERLSKTSALS